MKIYQVSFDATCITVLTKDLKSLFDILKKRNKDFYLKTPNDFENLYYRWYEGRPQFDDKCTIEEIPFEEQILHWESH